RRVGSLAGFVGLVDQLAEDLGTGHAARPGDGREPLSALPVEPHLHAVGVAAARPERELVGSEHHSRSFNASAVRRVMPGTDAMSSTPASRIAATDPNRC